jgi:RHS repeat-associated protein
MTTNISISSPMNRSRRVFHIIRHPWLMQPVTCVLVITQMLLPLGTALQATESVVLVRPVVENANTSSPIAPALHTGANREVPNVPPPVSELRFSANPTDAEILSARVFSTPVVSVGRVVSPGENQALAAALQEYHHRSNADDASALERFLGQHPDSPRRLALLVQLAAHYRETCQFSKALAVWQQVWDAGKNEQHPDAQDLVNQALGEWAAFLVTLGRMDDLAGLFKLVENRPIYGAARVQIDDAKSALWQMQNLPEQTFKCGPYSLYRVRATLGLPEAAHRLIHEETSTTNGTSLYQNWELANRMGMQYQMAKREPGAAIPLPAMIHWKLGHCSALAQMAHGRYLIQDPTFQDTWISAAVLDEEASGYFLIPAGRLPAGWSPVSAAEGKTVWGRSTPTSTDPTATTPCDEKTCAEPAGGNHGMAQYSVHLLRVSLSISDIPVGYQPPRGPAVMFRVTYNEREATQPSVFNYSNLGKQWSLDWVSYITDNPSVTNFASMRAGGGGGAYRFVAQGGGLFKPQRKSQSQLIKTSPHTFERVLPDGSKEVFNLPETSNSVARKVFMTAKVDPAGNAINFTYDANFRLVAVTDAIGQVSTLTYGSTNIANSLFYKVVQVTDPFGRYATFEYNESGRLTNVTDVIGMSSSFTYKPSTDTINSLTTPYGTTTFTNNSGGFNRWMEITDPAGGKERVEFHNSTYPALSSSVHPSLFPAGMTYGNHRLYADSTYYWDKRAMTEAPGDYTKAHIARWLSTEENYYQLASVKISEKAPLQSRVWYDYPGMHDSGWFGLIQEGSNNIPSKIGRVLDDGTTQLQRFERNAVGKTTKSIDPLGRTTWFTYATNHMDLLEVRQQIGTNEAHTELLAQVTYNSQHLPLTSVDASGQTNYFGYNAYGQLLAMTNALGETLSLTYDPDGYLTNVTGTLPGTTTSFTYDGFGRVRTVTDSEGFTVTTDYDALDRPTKVTYPDNTFEQIIYEKLDPVLVKDRRGHWTRKLYNHSRQLTAVADAAGRVTRLDWCDCGSLSGITDPLGRTTTWLRDLQGRVTAKVYPDATQIQYAYEPESGRLKSVTDAKNQTTFYDYFKDNNVQQVSYSNAVVATPTVSFAYDTNYNRLLTMTDGVGTTSYGYHVVTNTQLGAGQLASVDGPLANDTITYTYDELGRVKSRAIDGVAQAVTYDALGRVTVVTNALGSFTNAYVGVTGRLSTNAYPNGQQTVFSYYGSTNDFRLAEIRHSTLNSNLSTFSYTYDADGQIATWTQQSDVQTPQVWVTEYDPVDQLLGVTVRSNTVAGAILKRYVYAYDKAGNRTGETVGTSSTSSATSASHNSLNQLTSVEGGGQMRFTGSLDELGMVTVAGSAASFDSRNTNFTGFATTTTGTNIVPVIATDYSGNARTNQYQLVVTNNGVARTLLYDLNGNLTNTVTATTTNSYEWDAEDRLVRITQLSTNNPQLVSEFSYDGLNRLSRIVEKTNGVAQSTNWFVWIGTERCEERDSSGAMVTKRFFGQGQINYQPTALNLFYTTDHLGSVREMTDTASAVRVRYDYDPYGRVTQVAGDLASDFRYTGHYYHAQSGLHLAPFRAYDADSGRWLSRDPIQEEGGLNLYAYVENDPINATDELGLAPTFEGTPGNYHVNTARGGTKIPAYTVNINSGGGLVFGEMKPHPFPGQAAARAHFAANYNPSSGKQAKEAHRLMRLKLHNDYLSAVAKGDQRLAQKIAEMGRATRSSRMPTPSTFGARGGSLGRLGRIGMGLGLLLAPLSAQASAENVASGVRDFACDRMNGEDDWAYVDALSVRHELNQHGLFAGDIAMRSMYGWK